MINSQNITEPEVFLVSTGSVSCFKERMGYLYLIPCFKERMGYSYLIRWPATN